MTDISKEAVDALLQGVTDGPWQEFVDDSGGKWTGWPLSVEAISVTDKTIVRTGGQWPYEWDAKTSQAEAVANARFIAASRELVPALRAALDEAEDRIRKICLDALISYGQVEAERDALAAQLDAANALLRAFASTVGSYEADMHPMTRDSFNRVSAHLGAKP